MIENEMELMSKIIPNINSYTSPIVNSDYNAQCNLGDINILKIEVSCCGFWKSQIFINAKPGIFHMKKECTYTFIGVPK